MCASTVSRTNCGRPTAASRNWRTSSAGWRISSSASSRTSSSASAAPAPTPTRSRAAPRRSRRPTPATARQARPQERRLRSREQSQCGRRAASAGNDAAERAARPAGAGRRRRLPAPAAHRAPCRRHAGPTVVPGGGIGFTDGPREQYNAAIEAYRNGQYAQAEEQLKAFLAANGSHRLAPDAIFYLGETYFQRSRPREAAEQYLKLSTDFAKSTRAPEGMLRLGQSLAAARQQRTGLRDFRRSRQALSHRLAGGEEDRRSARCKRRIVEARASPPTPFGAAIDAIFAPLAERGRIAARRLRRARFDRAAADGRRLGAPARRSPAPRGGDRRSWLAGRERARRRAPSRELCEQLGVPHRILRVARRQAEEPHPGARARSALRACSRECADDDRRRRRRHRPSSRRSGGDRAVPPAARLGNRAACAPWRRCAARESVTIARPAARLRQARRSIAYCEAEGVAFARDPSNDDPRYARTRLRALGGALAAEGLDAPALARLARRAGAGRGRADAADRGRRDARLRLDRDRRLRRAAPCSPSRSRSCSALLTARDRARRRAGRRAASAWRRSRRWRPALREARRAGRDFSANVAGARVRCDGKGSVRVEPEPARRKSAKI